MPRTIKVVTRPPKRLILGLMLAGAMVGLSAFAQAPANAVWIDVRTPAEYAGGHVQQARLIPFDGIQAGVAALDLARDAPIYLYCAAGGRAEKARQSLLEMGYTNVTNAGGLDEARKLAGEGQP